MENTFVQKQLPWYQNQVGYRFRHRCFVYHETIFLFGGENKPFTLFEYDNRLNKWIRHDVDFSIESLQDFSVVVYENMCYIICGVGNDKSYSNTSIVSLNLENYQVARRDSGISERYLQSAVVVNTSILVFGGFNNGTCFSDLYELNLLELGPFIAIQPEKGHIVGRFNHSAVVFNDLMYIFGGFSLSHGDHNDLHSYDPICHEWKLIECTGAIPSPRWGQTCCVHGKEMIMYAGSEDPLGDPLDDMYFLDFSDFKWSKFNGITPRGRWGHQAVVVNDDMFVYGGEIKSHPFVRTPIESMSWHIFHMKSHYILQQNLKLRMVNHEFSDIFII
jgi:hypothetical protein